MYTKRLIRSNVDRRTACDFTRPTLERAGSRWMYDIRSFEVPAGKYRTFEPKVLIGSTQWNARHLWHYVATIRIPFFLIHHSWGDVYHPFARAICQPSKTLPTGYDNSPFPTTSRDAIIHIITTRKRLLAPEISHDLRIHTN